MDGNHVMVCVTRQKTCEKLILEGSKLAVSLSAELSVLHVAKQGFNFLGNPVEGQALEYLYKISSQHGADMTVIRSDNVISTIMNHAKKTEVNHIIIGKSRGHNTWDMADEFQQACPEIHMHVILT